MQISGYNPPELPGSKPPATNTPKSAPTALAVATSTASDSGVSLVMTSSARSMGRSGPSNAAEIDMKKVAAAKAAIANGTMKPDAGAIADKILAVTKELL